MLTLRTAQFEALQQQNIEQFEADLVRYLSGAFPHEVERRGEGAVRAVVKRSLRRALGYGLTETPAARAYVSLAFRLGEEFDQGPENAWARDILGSPLATTEKINLIIERLRA